MPLQDGHDFTELAARDPGLLTEIIAVSQQVATERSEGDYRLVFNTGANADQTDFHVLSGELVEGSL